MSRRLGARTGLAKPRETERELREVRWRERRKGDRKAVEMMRIEGLPAEVLRAVRLNSTAVILDRLHRATGHDSFRQAADDLASLGLDGADMMAKLDDIDPPRRYGEDAFLRDLVDLYREMCASEAQAIERAAEVGVVRATSFAGAVQKVKRAVYSRRQR